jgi:signal transduction histidine kinase
MEARRGGAADRLNAQQDRVLKTWVERVRGEVPAAQQESNPILFDTLPAFLSNLAEALTPGHPRKTASEGSTIPEEHGGERVRLTRFALRDLIREYQLLRDVVLEILAEDGALTDDERRVVVVSIDSAVRDACTAYALVYEGLRERMMLTVAHDIRGPLSAAKAGAALIMRRPADPSVSRWASRVDDNINRVDKLLRTLLDVSRAGAGSRLDLEFEPCELTAIIRNVVEALELAHGARFVVDVPEPIHGFWNPEALGRAVENLLTNAVKYGDRYRPVTVSTRGMLGRALVKVHNDGSYIAPGDRDSLFEAFRRSRQAEGRGVRGWGLGLALVRAVAEAHGGSVAVESLPETGTTFTMDFPLDARPFRKAAATSEAL